MSRVAIYVFLAGNNLRADLRTASWIGEVDWPGAPQPGSTWFHCSDWAGETVDRVSFYAPPTDLHGAGLVIEVRTDAEVLRHLVDDHGFRP